MKRDELIVKRLDQLSNKSDNVAMTRRKEDLDFARVNSEKFYEWGTSVLNILQSVFGESSAHYIQFFKGYESFRGLESDYLKCRGIFNSAKEDYQNGYLFKLKSLISAEVLDNVLEQAEELLSAGYKDSACVAIGITLETALKDLCSKNDIPFGKLDKMNSDLCKAGAYNLGLQKQITAWADRRNNAAHGNFDAYTKADVEDMLKGVNRFISEYM